MASMNVRPIPEIFTDLITQLTALVRKEGQLARTEISEKVARALSGVAMILLGAVLLIPALVILLQAAIAGLVENGMSASAAALIVGGAALVLGMILGLVGWSWVKPASLVPDRTIDQLRRDAAVPRHAAVTATYGETGGPTSQTMAGQETGHGDHRNRAA
jgi:Putative Actinobacterial Holin-X, holin superfamily III